MAKMNTSDAWQILLDKYDIKNEIESNGTFKITASQIKEVRKELKEKGEKYNRR